MPLTLALTIMIEPLYMLNARSMAFRQKATGKPTKIAACFNRLLPATLTAVCCSKGNDRAVTVFKQRGSRKHANDVFDLDFQQESVDLLKNHFQVSTQFQKTTACFVTVSSIPCTSVSCIHSCSTRLRTEASMQDFSASLLHANAAAHDILSAITCNNAI